VVAPGMTTGRSSLHRLASPAQSCDEVFTSIQAPGGYVDVLHLEHWQVPTRSSERGMNH
jgi:hypothetical protein